MSNRLFLMCSAHLTAEQGYCLGERSGTDPRYDCDPALGDYLSEWLRKHSACGNGPDHFQLAYQRKRDYDIVPLETVPAAVKSALLNGSH